LGNNSSHSYGLILMIALLLAGGGMYNYYKLSLLMPSIIADFEFSYGVAGLLAGFFGLIQLLLSIPLGMLVRGPSLRKVTAYALVVLILGSLLVCVVSDPYVLFVARLIEGAGAALALVAAPFLIYEVFAKQRVWLGLGVLMLFNPVGNILGLNVTSWFLKMFGWRGAWLTGVILPALALALLLVTKPVEIRIMSRSSITVKSGLGERLLIGLLQLGYSLTAMGFLMWAPTYMIEVYSFDASNASFITSLFMLIGMPTPIIGVWLSDKVGSRKVILAPSFGALALLYPLTTFTPSHLLPLHILAAGFFSGVVPAVIHICVVDLLGPYSNIGFGILNASRGFSLLFGPLILGAILNATSSWMLSFASLSLFAFLALICSLLLPRIK